MIEQVQFGRTGLKVSRLLLGTMNFGRTISEVDSIPILDEAVDLGINLIDTANTYGPIGQAGGTEEVLGRWFASRPGLRDRVLLATKVFGPMSSGDVNAGGLSARNIRRSLDASLRRLQTDHVDIYQFHHIDPSVPWDEIWEAMDVAIQQGKVIYVGSSNFAGWNIAEAQSNRERNSRVGLISEQSLYNLVRREIEREVIPAADRYGVTIIPWSPLHGGLLAGADDDSVRRSQARSQQDCDRIASQLADFEAFCADFGRAPAEIALSWLLHQPAVHGPVIGPRTPGQLRSAVAALDIRLDTGALESLDKIFPPAGTAPEYYAW